ncbi:DUF4254 domain-containing protein [Nocardia ninae]|uniref:DUF4254 domain-containing protein n=1 Tax=Nocardia ninae NBRC 108245 TaxID=1210091 RepID=A0A511MT92_9NOCA|nr:DUF4254 domain-containing protein [Nocardia ninae]GEM43448.1 hypothetical protein NN4_79670 [Nocardia ninae NBRC 108245]
MELTPNQEVGQPESDGSEAGMAASFLSGGALLSAIRGHHVGIHPLADLARQFGLMYQRRQDASATEFHCRRSELMRAVDAWAAEHQTSPHPNATLHTETLGSVIDQVAEAHVHAYQLLMTINPTDPAVHAAWFRLAELVDSYSDLITKVIQRSRRLPTSSTQTREHP